MTNIPLPRRGLKTYRSLDLDEGAAEVIKASAGCLYGIWVTNNATTVRYLKLYDRASATAGTHTPIITIGIPGNSTDKISAFLGTGGVGIQFLTGICAAVTTGIADADTGAPGGSDIQANFFYI